jgi:hypothetical protein
MKTCVTAIRLSHQTVEHAYAHPHACLLCCRFILDNSYYLIETSSHNQTMCVSCFDTFYVLAAELKGGHGTLKAIKERKENTHEQP